MLLRKFVLVLSCSVVVVFGVPKLKGKRIPSYITPCSKKSADFRKCCTEHGNNALPMLLKGDKSLNIPNLLPYHITSVVADAGPNLKITVSEVDVFGLETVKVTDMNVDFDKKSVYIAIQAEHINLIGTYNIDGKILILPIKGLGPMNITIVNSEFKYSFDFKLENRGGIDYLIIQNNDSLDWKIGKAHFKLDNLFDGNKQMGDNINKFLNENDQDIVNELSGTIKAIIKSIARTIGGGVLSTVPFKDLFLP